MSTATINLQLDEQAASIYQMASPREQEKLSILLSLWMKEFGSPQSPLLTLMDEIGEQAKKRGLTPEILASLLDE